jgi:hypothetical protein
MHRTVLLAADAAKRRGIAILAICNYFAQLYDMRVTLQCTALDM